MEGNWNVFFEDRPVGACRLWREGLYYCVSCRCDNITKSICRLILKCGEKTVDLGVLVPAGGGFGLEKRIPVKNVPVGRPEFIIRSSEQHDTFIRVIPGEPFAYLARLGEARFVRRNGDVGVVLEDRSY